MPRRKTEDEAPDVELDADELTRIRAVNEERIQSRIADYHLDFEEKSLTRVDKSQIRYMAQLEIAAGDAIDALTTTPSLTPAQRKALADSAKSLIAETRQLADTLGMSRKSRMTDEDSKINEYLPNLHAETQKFLREHAIMIVCPKCRKDPAEIEIRQGAIIFNFAFETDWIWRSRCPRITGKDAAGKETTCGNRIEINSSNYHDFILPVGAKKPTSAGIEDEVAEDDDGGDDDE